MLCCDVISVYMLVIVFCIVYRGSSPMYKVLAIILACLCHICLLCSFGLYVWVHHPCIWFLHSVAVLFCACQFCGCPKWFLCQVIITNCFIFSNAFQWYWYLIYFAICYFCHLPIAICHLLCFAILTLICDFDILCHVVCHSIFLLHTVCFKYLVAMSTCGFK